MWCQIELVPNLERSLGPQQAPSLRGESAHSVKGEVENNGAAMTPGTIPRYLTGGPPKYTFKISLFNVRMASENVDCYHKSAKIIF